MINDEGVNVDLYIPRKCSFTNTIIAAEDHASIQLNIGKVNAKGVFSGEFDTIALSGSIRGSGKSDSAINEIAVKKGIVRNL